jgi:tripartite-type tricarboxylate transporter receptor subunit TctC
MSPRRRQLLIVQGLWAAGGWTTLRAQAYPAREVLIVVPNEPGGGLDLVARLLAKGLTASLGQTVNVVNRSGASGNVGAASVARGEPDGHTLLLSGVGHVVSPLLHDKPGYDALKDFVPLARIATAPNVLLVHESLKGLGLSQLLADPRSRNRGLAYASAGFGHSSHLAAEVFMRSTGARWLHVPYRGTAPASRALLGGEVQLMFVPSGSVQPLLASGKAQAIAVSHPQRLAALPQTPTLAELGVSGAEFGQWYGLFAPASTPDAVCDLLHRAVAASLADASTREQLLAQGLTAAATSRAAFASFVAEEEQRLKAVLRRRPVDEASR